MEWTPGILPHPAVRMAMRTNWWGLLGRRFKRSFGRLGSGEVLSGIIGRPTDHGPTPYAITEEFVSVYRLHPLIPDQWLLHSSETGQLINARTFEEVAGKRTRALMEDYRMEDLW